jgi:hypothetical protein
MAGETPRTIQQNHSNHSTKTNQPSTVSNGFHVNYEAKSSQIVEFLGLPQDVNSLQKEFRADFWKTELEVVVFLSDSHFGCSVSMREGESGFFVIYRR